MRYLIRLIPVLTLLLVAALALAPAGAPARAQGEVIEVDIRNFAFNPPSITVNVGDTVRWVNYDVGVPHNASALDGTFDTEVVEGSADGTVSGSYTFTADDVGTHEYRCDVHPDMRGTVTVVAAAGDDQADDQEDDQQAGGDDDQQDDDQQAGGDDDDQDDMPDDLPDTGAGGMAGGFPTGAVAAGLSLLLAAGYAALRRR